MIKEKNILLFAKYIDSNYYFTRISKKNRWEWSYDSDDHIVIFGEDPMEISGLGEIGAMTMTLGLCCSVRFDFYNRRIEVHVH